MAENIASAVGLDYKKYNRNAPKEKVRKEENGKEEKPEKEENGKEEKPEKEENRKKAKPESAEERKREHKMKIRRATEKDIEKIMELLGQVLEVHAAIRPDIFIPGTTKYTKEELSVILADDTRPIYAAVDEEDRMIGYAFCILTEQPKSDNMIPFTSLYIDDLCVDECGRGKGVGKALFEHVKAEARRLGCREVTLNVWEGNDSARIFYEHQGMTPMKTYMELVL